MRSVDMYCGYRGVEGPDHCAMLNPSYMVCEVECWSVSTHPVHAQALGGWNARPATRVVCRQ